MPKNINIPVTEEQHDIYTRAATDWMNQHNPAASNRALSAWLRFVADKAAKQQLNK